MSVKISLCGELLSGRFGQGCLRSFANHRLAWRAIQWRVWLGEACRAGRAFVAGRLCVDPLKRRRKYCDDHRDSEKHDGGTVAILLVTHGEASTKGDM